MSDDSTVTIFQGIIRQITVVDIGVPICRKIASNSFYQTVVLLFLKQIWELVIIIGVKKIYIDFRYGKVASLEMRLMHGVTIRSNVW